MHMLQHAAMVSIDKVAQADLAASPDTRGNYICTGYHIYLSQEPCIM